MHIFSLLISISLNVTVKKCQYSLLWIECEMLTELNGKNVVLFIIIFQKIGFILRNFSFHGVKQSNSSENNQVDVLNSEWRNYEVIKSTQMGDNEQKQLSIFQWAISHLVY